jgi:hypothetical protein
MSSRQLVLLAGALIVFWSVQRWRDAIRFALVLVVLEGAIRKWLLPGAQDLVYFAKDAVLLAAYVGFWQDQARARLPRLVPPPLALLLLGSVLVGTLQMFNENLPSVLVGVLGLKAYFLYVPLLWVVPAAWPDEARLARDLRIYVALAIPVAVLAFVQFASGSNSALNTYVGGGEGGGGIIQFGSSEHVRVTATFSFISGLSAYLPVVVVLALVELTRCRWKLASGGVAFVSLGASLAATLMTGSRGPALVLALLVPLFAWLAGSGGAGSGRLMVGLGIALLSVRLLAGDAIDAFIGRAEGASDVSERLLSPLVSPRFALEAGGLAGFGIGATHQAAPLLASGVPEYSWLRGAQIEDEAGRVMLELGPIGFGMVYGTRIYLALFALSQTLRLRGALSRPLGAGAALILFFSIPGGIIFNPTAGVLYWLAAGLFMAALRLEWEARTSVPRLAPRPVLVSG